MTKRDLLRDRAIRVGLPALLLLVPLSLFVGAPAGAQEPAEPALVRDIDPSSSEGSSLPETLIELDGVAVFTAEDPLHGRELWASDATVGGTRRIADICPGACSTTFFFRWVAGGRYFFHAVPELPRLPEGADPAIVPGRGLWSTDGTPDGTRFLGHFEQGNDLVAHLATIEPTGIHIFGVTDEEHGTEPWRTDGTPGGTWRLGDFFPGPEDSRTGGCYGAGVLGDQAYLALLTPESGCELWRTDGSSAGTIQVRDIEPGTGSSWPVGLAVLGDRFLFQAIQEGHGDEIWTTDGTRAGTGRLTEIGPGAQSAYFASGARVEGGYAYFLAASRTVPEPMFGTPVAVYELWRTDGTAGGTRRITRFGHPYAFRRDLYDPDLRYYLAARFVAVGSTVYFEADGGSTGRELWVSDGTPESSRLFADLCPGECSSHPFFLTAHGSPPGAVSLSFTATDGVHGREIWTSDRTAAGTRMLIDACLGDCSSVIAGWEDLGDTRVTAFGPENFEHDDRLWALGPTPSSTRELERWDGASAFLEPRPTGGSSLSVPMARVGDQVVFAVTDEPDGREPWVTAGTPASTRPLVNLVGEVGHGANGREMKTSGGRVFFFADDGTRGDEIWVTDGSAEGTRPIRIGPPPCADCRPRPVSSFHPAAGLIFYWEDVPPGFDVVLWRSDGTDAGTFEIAGPFRDTGSEFVTLRGTVYFSAGEGLWRSDGTPGGTVEVVGPELAEEPTRLTVYRDELYFFADAPGSGRTLWKSDGTPAGTRIVADGLEVASHVLSGPLPVAAGRLFLLARDEARGTEIWSTDGTAVGTRFEFEVRQGPESSQVLFLGVVGDRVVFSARTPEDGPALYATSGGTAIRLRHFAADSLRSEVATIGGLRRLFLVIDDGEHGEELWITDGSPTGTRLVKDVFPGVVSSRPYLLTPAGGLLFFQAFDPDLGRQIWRSDGTAAGTWRVTGLAERPALSGDYASMAALGDRLLFAGIDLEHGQEPWSLPLEAGPVAAPDDPDDPEDGTDPPPPIGAWLTTDAVPGFRFKVRIAQGANGSIAGAPESHCIPETLCVSGALPGRSEVFLRVVGPRPNGKLWPTLVKFTTSEVEVWIEQLVTGVVRYYRLDGARPGVDVLNGLFDRDGFDP